MTTPRHGFPELPTGQNASPETMNEALRYAEQGANRFVVKDKDLTSAPGSPAAGDAYIVGSGATGTWASHDNAIAIYISTSWVYITPKEGDVAEPIDEDILYRYSGSAWASTQATASDVWTGTNQTKYISPKTAQDAQAPTALTSSASITPDFNAGSNFTLTLAHSGQLENPSNLQAGDSGAIEITQDGTGNRTLSYGTQWKFPGGAPVLSTAAGAVDLITYWAPTTGRILATLTKAYTS